MSIITMTCKLSFSSAHADWVEEWSPEENAAVYGIDAIREPYGHNYQLNVSVRGSVNPKTSIVVNTVEIEAIVRQVVIDRLHKRTIAEAIPEFKRRPLTLESLTLYIVDQLREQIPSDTHPDVHISALELAATPTIRCRWTDSAHDTSGYQRGIEEERDMFMTHAYEFAASHRLHSPHLTDEENRALFGKCNYQNGHGHNYQIEVTVTGPLAPCVQRIIDPDKLDAIVRAAIIDRYDHRHFNLDFEEFQEVVPSAEMVTKTIWDRLVDEIPAPVRLHKVLLRENPHNAFEYFGESANS